MMMNITNLLSEAITLIFRSYLVLATDYYAVNAA